MSIFCQLAMSLQESNAVAGQMFARQCPSIVQTGGRLHHHQPETGRTQEPRPTWPTPVSMTVFLERCAPILFAGKNFREENAGATRQAAKDIVNRKHE